MSVCCGRPGFPTSFVTSASTTPKTQHRYRCLTAGSSLALLPQKGCWLILFGPQLLAFPFAGSRTHLGSGTAPLPCPCLLALCHLRLFCKNNWSGHFYSVCCSFFIKYTSPWKMPFTLTGSPGIYCWHRPQPIMLTNALMIGKTLTGMAGFGFNLQHADSTWW